LRVVGKGSWRRNGSLRWRDERRHRRLLGLKGGEELLDLICHLDLASLEIGHSLLVRIQLALKPLVKAVCCEELVSEVVRFVWRVKKGMLGVVRSIEGIWRRGKGSVGSEGGGLAPPWTWVYSLKLRE
jgi:hypothetical protein